MTPGDNDVHTPPQSSDIPDESVQPEEGGYPDAVETDPAALSSSPGLDPDALDMDPQEKGIEPPERWAGIDPAEPDPEREQEEGHVDERLTEERPDAPAPAEPPRPIAETPDTQLDETIDYVTDDTGFTASGEPRREHHPEAARWGQSADEAGGSVAETLRTPDEPE